MVHIITTFVLLLFIDQAEWHPVKTHVNSLLGDRLFSQSQVKKKKNCIWKANGKQIKTLWLFAGEPPCEQPQS